jgi:hypothetical protein
MLLHIILFMCRHCDTVICSPILCEWLLYSSCIVTMTQLNVGQCSVSGYCVVHSVVTVIQFYVAQYYVSGYYIVHLS